LEKTRRLAETVLKRHPESFSTDYEKNKKALEELALIPSKQLRNQIAGYIAKSLKEDEEETEEVAEEAKAE
jgi:small subunit ribosomal protein S17e